MTPSPPQRRTGAQRGRTWLNVVERVGAAERRGAVDTVGTPTEGKFVNLVRRVAVPMILLLILSACSANVSITEVFDAEDPGLDSATAGDDREEAAPNVPTPDQDADEPATDETADPATDAASRQETASGVETIDWTPCDIL